MHPIAALLAGPAPRFVVDDAPAPLAFRPSDVVALFAVAVEAQFGNPALVAAAPFAVLASHGFVEWAGEQPDGRVWAELTDAGFSWLADESGLTPP